MRSEEQAIKFEETVETIKRREKAEEFKRKELQVQQRTCSPASVFFIGTCTSHLLCCIPFLFPSVRLFVCDQWCGVCAEMKQERTKLLEQEKLRIASKRRYAAQQFLIQQEEQRDELERSAMNKVSRKRTSCNSLNAFGKSR